MKGAAFVLGGLVISKLISFFYRIIVARFLLPSELGIFSIGIAVFGLATVFGALGLYQGVLHFVAVFDAQKKKANVRGTIIGSLKLQLFFSLFFAAILFISAKTIALLFFNEPKVELVLQILAFTIPFQIITSNFMILAQAFKKIEYKVLMRNIFENIAKLVLTFLFVFYGFGAAGASMALALSAAFIFVVSLYLVQGKIYAVFQKGAPAVYNLRQLFSYSWPLLAVDSFMVLMQNIDTISLGILSTAYNTGIYNVATPTARVLDIPAFALVSLFLPVVTGLYATKKLTELSGMYKTITRWIFILEFPCTLFAAIFSIEILGIMFGPVYAEGAGALAVLSFGTFVYSMSTTARPMLESIAKTKLILLNTFVASLLNVFLNIALIPPFGIIGAALATATAYLVLNLLSVLEVFLGTGMHPYSSAYLRPIIASFAAGALFYALRQFIPSLNSFAFPIDFLLLALCGIAFLAVYALIFLVIKGLQKEDIEILKAIERKTGYRVNFLRRVMKRFS